MADDLERYHLTLILDGRPAMSGWWASEKTARRQFSSWIGERGSIGREDQLLQLVDQHHPGAGHDDRGAGSVSQAVRLVGPVAEGHLVVSGRP